MPGMSAQWIAKDVTINGLPASMRSVQVSLPLSEVLRYYRQQWAGRIDERVEGQWHVLATRHRDRFVSLRLRASGNSVQGILTDSRDPDSAVPGLDSALPVPPGLVRLSHQVFRDGPARGENLTLMSSRSVAYERQAFDAIYRGEGWVNIEDRAAHTVADAHVLQFLRGKQSARIVFYRDPALADGNTLILLTAH